MAIPSAPFANTVILQAGNLNTLVSWPIISGATSYSVQRSTDGVNFTVVGTPAVNNFLDTTVLVGVLYYYQVAAVNISGTSAYTASAPDAIVPCLPGQVNLRYLRYQAQLRCDQYNQLQYNPAFMTLDEWNIAINKSMFELFDILVTKDGENYIMASPYTITTTGDKNYALPDGSTNFSVGGVTPPAVFKILGVDCGVAVGNNAWVTLPRYNWIDRNRFIYPQLQANALGVFNLSYRQMGNSLYFIPNPTAGQFIQLWYVPIMTMLLQDTDMLSFSISGWDEYVIIDAAIKGATKEESWDLVSSLKADKALILDRIITAAGNRDQSQPNTISDVRTNCGFFDGGGFGGSGHGMGGWMVLLAPGFSANHIGNRLLIHSIFASQSDLIYITFIILASYFGYFFFSKLCRWVGFSGMRNSLSDSLSSFANHIHMIFSGSSHKKMIRSYTKPNVAFMTGIQMLWKRAIMKFKRKSVSTSCLSKSISSNFNFLDNNSTISLTVGVSSPQPTRFSFMNLLPKSLNSFFCKHDRGIS